MPDWLTHTLAGWITGKVVKKEVGLIVAGSLIPDITKINMIFLYFDINLRQIFDPFHTPIGAFLIAGIFALFFKDIKKAFILIGIGVITHFILDFFLVHVSSKMKLFFPFSWSNWQYPMIRYDDYNVTIAAIFIAFLIYTLYFYFEKKA